MNLKPPAPQRSTGRIWLVAILATLLLHLLVFMGVIITRPFTPAPLAAQEPDPIQLVFTDPVPPQPKSQEPTQFTELPPDRADQAPEHPDFLSNVDSRARDEVPGGADALPHSEGESEFPHVEMLPGAPQPKDPAAEQGDAEEASKPVPEPAPEEKQTSEDDKKTVAPGGTFETPLESSDKPKTPPPPAPDPLAGLLRKKGGAETQNPTKFQRPEGIYDIIQEALRNTNGNADLFGGVSMNTTAWDFAPWLQRFMREFVRDWNAPTAYYMGIIWGKHEIQLEIGRDGSLMRMDVLSQEGHESLIQASELSFETIAPFEPLPRDFPEPTLILNITLTYPRIRHR